MTTRIKVAVAGASGALGSSVTHELLANPDKFVRYRSHALCESEVWERERGTVPNVLLGSDGPGTA